ncbi:MAG: GtrA family protein [Gemmatimonadota bacterium]
MIGQLVRFGLVGVAAAATHFVVAVACVRGLAIDPQLANVVGFLVAFTVSFLGQWRWTFAAHAAPLMRALPSFFLVSLTGFLTNAAAYHWLLTHTALRYDVALAIVLIGVAAMTFMLSRFWAFRRAR